MLKLVGACLVLIACTSLGFHIAKGYRDRPLHIRYLMHAIRLLQAEIEFSVTPLPEAFGKVAVHARYPCTVLFEVAANRLAHGEVSAADALFAGVEEMKPKCALRETDFTIFMDFAKVLGTADRVHLTKQFKATLTHFEELEKDAKEAQKRNERMCQYLGVLTGMLFIILMY
jgi:stage III sporulation protein AB